MYTFNVFEFDFQYLTLTVPPHMIGVVITGRCTPQFCVPFQGTIHEGGSLKRKGEDTPGTAGVTTSRRHWKHE